MTLYVDVIKWAEEYNITIIIGQFQLGTLMARAAATLQESIHISIRRIEEEEKC